MKKLKKFLLIFLCFVILFVYSFPLKSAAALGPGVFILGGLTLIGAIIGINYIPDWIKEPTARFFASALAFIIKIVTSIFFSIVQFLNNNLLAPIINEVSKLNPFQSSGNVSPVGIFWNILVNLSYIILVFSALFAGFQWLFEGEEVAKKLIFKIIIVALLINFSFVLVKEAFNIVDALEIGLTGGNSKQIGTIIAASLWQRDPFEEIESFLNKQIPTTKDSEAIQYIYKDIIRALSFLFLLIFQFLIFFILIITLFLFIARYVIIVTLAGISPLAFVSVTFPEFKGELGRIFSSFRFFGSWLSYFIRWLLITPIFVILVILGNTIQKNSFEQLGISSTSTVATTGSNVFEFALILFFLFTWYILAIIFTVRFSNGIGNMARGIALGALLGIGGVTTGALAFLSRGAVGQGLKSAGGFVAERIPPGGPFGLRSRLINLGERIRGRGQKILEETYEADAQAAKMQFRSLSEKLEIATDPNEIARLSQQMSNLMKRFERNLYVLQKLNEDVEKMRMISFEKLMTNPDALQALTPLMSPQAPSETRRVIADKIGKLSGVTTTKILSDPNLLNILSSASADIMSAFIDQVSDKVKESHHVLRILTRARETGNLDSVLTAINKNPELQRTLDRISNNLISALLEENIQQKINKLKEVVVDFSPEAWRNFDDIRALLNARGVEDQHIQNTLLPEVIRRNPGVIIPQIQRAAPRSAIRQFIADYAKSNLQDFQNLLNTLTPQQRRILEAIAQNP